MWKKETGVKDCICIIILFLLGVRVSYLYWWYTCVVYVLEPSRHPSTRGPVPTFKRVRDTHDREPTSPRGDAQDVKCRVSKFRPRFSSFTFMWPWSFLSEGETVVWGRGRNYFELSHKRRFLFTNFPGQHNRVSSITPHINLHSPLFNYWPDGGFVFPPSFRRVCDWNLLNSFRSKCLFVRRKETKGSRLRDSGTLENRGVIDRNLRIKQTL